MNTTSCKHPKSARETIRTAGYTGGVAVYPHTEQEPRAAGGICCTERCNVCGMERRENSNGRYVERSPWAAPARRGRPPVAGETRTQQIRVRLTPTEHAHLHVYCEAADVDAAELVRERLADIIGP